jgi:hypothetical protein
MRLFHDFSEDNPRIPMKSLPKPLFFQKSGKAFEEALPPPFYRKYFPVNILFQKPN